MSAPNRDSVSEVLAMHRKVDEEVCGASKGQSKVAEVGDV
jgi:hypothetical protein